MRKKTPKPKNKSDIPASPKPKKKATPKKSVKEKAEKKKVEKPFADGTMTSAAFFGMLRSCLRRKSMYWPCIQKARKAAQIPYVGPSKRLKYLYVCADCGGAFPSVQCNVHHQEECGSLKSFEDIGEFVRKLFCDSEFLIVLCSECHDKRHNKNSN